MLDDPKITTATSSKTEMLQFFRDMYTIRRMEIACDTEYKARNIRGFCHLYDGQEAIAAGLQAALSKDDDVISGYRCGMAAAGALRPTRVSGIPRRARPLTRRCHGLQLIRGDSVKAIVAELFGFEMGSSKGKGGSMHFYSKRNRFWGGSGIVGAQVPVGVGLAFANMYKSGKKWPTTVSVSM